MALSQVKICYDLAGLAEVVDVEEKGKKEQAPVIPDGWLLFERQKRGGEPKRFPVLLEIDRGTMYRERIKRHVASGIEFVRGGGYRRVFGTEAVVIAYVAVGERGEDGRRKALCGWTRELLKEQGRENWGNAFRISSVPFGKIYDSPLFEGKVWYKPGEETPVGLLTG